MDPLGGATGNGPVSCGTVREADKERGLKPGVVVMNPGSVIEKKTQRSGRRAVIEAD